jgi:hypothetical protein
MIISIRSITGMAALAGIALVVSGCADSTTREDVADAREELREEQADLAEARQEAQDEVADAREEAREHTVGKPVLEDDAVEARQELAETRADAEAEIADERQDVQSAAADLRTEQQRLQATQARDAYVNDVENRLAEIEKNIEQMESQAGQSEATDKESLELRVDSLKDQHQRAQEALEALKDADLASWENHKQQVRTAMQGIENDVR